MGLAFSHHMKDVAYDDVVYDSPYYWPYITAGEMFTTKFDVAGVQAAEDRKTQSRKSSSTVDYTIYYERDDENSSTKNLKRSPSPCCIVLILAVTLVVLAGLGCAAYFIAKMMLDDADSEKGSIQLRRTYTASIIDRSTDWTDEFNDLASSTSQMFVSSFETQLQQGFTSNRFNASVKVTRLSKFQEAKLLRQIQEKVNISCVITLEDISLPDSSAAFKTVLSSVAKSVNANWHVDHVVEVLPVETSTSTKDNVSLTTDSSASQSASTWPSERSSDATSSESSPHGTVTSITTQSDSRSSSYVDIDTSENATTPQSSSSLSVSQPTVFTSGVTSVATDGITLDSSHLQTSGYVATSAGEIPHRTTPANLSAATSVSETEPSATTAPQANPAATGPPSITNIWATTESERIPEAKLLSTSAATIEKSNTIVDEISTSGTGEETVSHVTISQKTERPVETSTLKDNDSTDLINPNVSITTVGDKLPYVQTKTPS